MINMELSLKEGLSNIRAMDNDAKGKYGGALINELGTALKKSEHPITIDNAFIILSSFASIAQIELKEEPKEEILNMINSSLRWSQYPSEHSFDEYKEQYEQVKKYSSSNLDEYLTLIPKDKQTIIVLLFSLFGARDNKIPRPITTLCDYYRKNKHWEEGIIEKEAKPKEPETKKPTDSKPVEGLVIEKGGSKEAIGKGSHSSSSSSSSASHSSSSSGGFPTSVDLDAATRRFEGSPEPTKKPTSSSAPTKKPTSSSSPTKKPTTPKPTYSKKPTTSSSPTPTYSSIKSEYGKPMEFDFGSFMGGFAFGVFFNIIGVFAAVVMKSKYHIIGSVVGMLLIDFIGVILALLH